MLTLPPAVSGQENALYAVKLALDKDCKADKGKLLGTTSWITADSAEFTAQRVITRLQLEGYADAVFDSAVVTGKLITLFISSGKVYRWKGIDPGNTMPAALSNAGFREKIYRKRVLSGRDVRRLYKGIIGYYENQGYPFAAVRFDSLSILDNRMFGRLHVQKNKLVRIDSVVMRGDARISEQYISNYISIKEGDIYRENRVTSIKTRLDELPFIAVERPYEVAFDEKETRLYLYLNHKKANDFQGILGVQPDSNGKTIITGDISLKLQNAFGNGEIVDINWRRMQTQTQDLKARVQYPFLFDWPLGLDAALHIYRRDTSFTTLNTNLGLQYLLRGGDYIKVFWEYEQSALISTAGMENISQLPEISDIRISSYGLGGKTIRLDYRLNPRKGFKAEGDFSFGEREILRNARINKAVYDSINLKSLRYKGRGEAALFVPVAGRSALMLGLKGGYVVSDRLFANELFRIGGMRVLRGFDEESVFASSYAIGTLEFRYLLEKNSFFHLFFDGGWYENAAAPQLISDTPYGFGSGVTFETKIGIFSLSYALGRQFNNPILLRTGKIHFGFVNYF